MKFFFIVGENSGDALAAPLIKSLKAQSPSDITCMGVGGPRMKAEGFDELLPMDQISVIGLWEVLPKIPRLLQINKAIIEEIEEQQPNVVITVDFPDFNFILAKKLKKRGVYKGKIVHYVSPSVWAWRPGRAKKIASFLDGMMCLYPMEAEHFTKHGMKAEHVGHPLVTEPVHETSGAQFRSESDIPEDSITIGLFLGSRSNEFKNIAPILRDSVSFLAESDIGKPLHVITPTLPDLEYNVQKILEGFKPPLYVTASLEKKWGAFKACDIAIAVSGTVALELAYAGTPHIIAYKINPITAFILKLLVKVRRAHLANILLDKDLVPECLQSKCSVENISPIMLDLINNPEKRQEQKEAFTGLSAMLNNADKIPPSDKAASFILDMCR